MTRCRNGTDEIKACPLDFLHLIGGEIFGLFQRNYGCIERHYVNLTGLLLRLYSISGIPQLR